MWSWIPIIGPFIQGAVNMFAKFEDTKVQTLAIKTNADVETVQARAQLATAFKDDIGVKFARDIILNWYAVWVSLVFYDSCFRNLLPDAWTWRVLALPSSVSYLCSGIVAFLFITAWRG